MDTQYEQGWKMGNMHAKLNFEAMGSRKWSREFRNGYSDGYYEGKYG